MGSLQFNVAVVPRFHEMAPMPPAVVSVERVRLERVFLPDVCRDVLVTSAPLSDLMSIPGFTVLGDEPYGFRMHR